MSSICRQGIALGLVVTVSALAGCGDDAVSYSAPVGINLKVKSDDVDNGAINEEKGITTESGNPYGAFIADAQAALDGADPSSIELDELTLILGGDATGVTTLEEIFDGTVDVLLVMNDTDNVFSAGTVDITEPVGDGPIDLDIELDGEAIEGEDWTKLLGGSFKVAIRGPAAASFEAASADADLQLTFSFVALE